MKLWIGITDENWFKFLSASMPDEVNFWQPSGSREFRSLKFGEPFLFKLHSPKNFIVGGGYFIRYSPLPYSLAWEAFGEKNGVISQVDFLERVRKYRRKIEPDPVVGCNVLADPFFFPEELWIPVPLDWSPNIVQGKTYDTMHEPGASLWKSVQNVLGVLKLGYENEVREQERRDPPEYLIKGRLGQGAFRVLVTDAYQRRCAIKGERTLPVLEAAHIKPYAQLGPNHIQNGLLLRSDLHKLFDLGYLTITPELHVEVSKRIKEEYTNGREYYAHHGQRLSILPASELDMPSLEYLEWHNSNVYVE